MSEIGRLMGWAMLCSLPALAGEGTGKSPMGVPLSEADRIALTTLLVSRHPEIASSPGLKASYYTEGGATDDCGLHEVHQSRLDREGVEIKMVPRTDCDIDSASLYFLPHSERLGRGEAARVNCKRSTIARVPPGAAPPQWTCLEVNFREYVQLEGQICEVRLRGEMSTPALAAAREAGLQAISEAGQPLPEALVVYTTHKSSHGYATFGTNDCRPGTGVEFSLVEGGNPEDPASWETKVLKIR